MNEWTKEELAIFAEFNGRCAKCGLPAVTLHEIIPKSKLPKTWNTPENRIPLCNEHHIEAHAKGTKASRAELRSLRFGGRYYRGTSNNS
jgi:5-methylcytosine-specific restriction endonuclease McrA